jgi:arylsulfatase A-like enzyme
VVILVALSGVGCGAERGQDRPNVILISLDTTRRDRLGCYGSDRATSPNLDRLAKESVLYTKAFAPSSWTLPSHASLFTGKFTTSHGARFDPEGPLCLAGHLEGSNEYWNRFRARGLAPGETTIATILRDADYRTGGIAAGPWLKEVFGLDQGFDFWDDDQIGTSNGRLAPQVTDAAIRWVRQVQGDEFFLFANYFDPHFPYDPPIEFARRFLPDLGKRRRGKKVRREDINALYDAEISYMDHHVGRLLDEIRRLGLYDDALIVVASDHGEMLGEHGRTGHGNRLFQEEIHIPLLIKYPSGSVAPGVEDRPIQLTDIMPLILDRLGIPIPEGIQGTVPPDVAHPLIAEIYPLDALSEDGETLAILEGDFKYVWNARGNHALHDLASDPRELVNLIDEEKDRARAMESRLSGYLQSLPRPLDGGETQLLDEETREALENLGYIE